MKILTVIAIIALPAAALLFVTAAILFERNFSNSVRKVPGRNYSDPWGRHRDRHNEEKAWFKAQLMEDLWITSADELRLHASYLKSEDPERIIICAHGFRSSPAGDFSGPSLWLHGSSDLILIDQRASGQSEGKWIGIGGKEAGDIIEWAKLVSEMNEKELPVYLYGMSMGASACLSASGMALPDCVTAVIADSGFSELKPMIAFAVRNWFHMPPFLLMWAVDVIAKIRTGCKMADFYPARELKKCSVPVLFIHGTADQIVSFWHLDVNYGACPGVKDKLVVEGAKHCLSFYDDTAKYKQKVRKLFERCELQKKLEVWQKIY